MDEVDVSQPATQAEGIQSQVSEPEQQEVTGTSEAEQEHTEQPQETEEEKKSKFQRRLERHKTRAIAAETEARLLREQLAALEGQRNQPQQRTEQPQGKPRLADYADFDTYAEALGEWSEKRAVQAYEQRQREQTQRQQAESQQAYQSRIESSWSEKVAEAQDEIPDWDVVAESNVTITMPMQSAIKESDHGPKIAYYLAKNPNEAARIAQLSPVRQVAEIGRLEDRVAAVKPPPKKPSQAPEPISPVGGSKAVSGNAPSDNMSIADWMAARNKQVRKR